MHLYFLFLLECTTSEYFVSLLGWILLAEKKNNKTSLIKLNTINALIVDLKCNKSERLLTPHRYRYICVHLLANSPTLTENILRSGVALCIYYIELH